MKRPDIIKCEPELLKYIEYLEGCLNGSSELILSLNTASRIFAQDLNLICNGESIEWRSDGENDTPKSLLTLLSPDSKDKTFDRIMILFDKFDKIKALSQHFKGTSVVKSESIKLKPGDNIYENSLEKIKNGSTRI